MAKEQNGVTSHESLKMKLNYIQDKEINLYEEDVLGTLPYVKTLSEIIENCKAPFTISLLGSWGSGKSSIVETLKKQLNSEHKKDISFFVYDAWKYSQDSFRRTFILELKKHFNLETTEEFNSFYHDKHEEVAGKIEMSKRVWINILIYSPILVAIALFVFNNNLSENILAAFFAIFFSLLGNLIKDSFVQLKVSVTKPKTFAPEQFEKIFGEIIDKALSKDRTIWNWIKGVFGRKIKKIVIAIDNIDRCHKELAYELLLTVKNFLEIDGVVFLLPVDEEGLKKYLRMETPRDSSEFLKKMFNTTLKIKSFSPKELYDFAVKLNKKHALGLSYTILSMACQEYSKNPRRIIQFLNTIQTEIFFAKQQEELKLIAKGAVSSNLDMLARIIVIREEWSDLYETLADSPFLLKEIDEALRDRKYIFNKEKKVWTLETEPVIYLSEEQYRFMVRTQNFESDNLEPFFITKNTFGDVPDKLNNLVLSQDWEAIKKLISEKQLSFERLFDFIYAKMDTDIIKNDLMLTSGFNLLSLIFKIAVDSEFSKSIDDMYNENSFKKITSILGKQEIEDLIFKFNPEELINFAKKLSLKGFNHLRTKIIDSINKLNPAVSSPSDAKLNTIRLFIANFSDTPNLLKKIQNTFSQILASKPEYYNFFKDVLQTKEILNNLIEQDVLFNFINHLTPQNINENVKNRIIILQDLNKFNLIKQEAINSYMQSAMQFINNNDLNSMDFYYSASKGFLEKVNEKHLLDSILNALKNRFSGYLYPVYRQGQMGDPYLSAYVGFLTASKEIYCALKAQNVDPINWMLNFFEIGRPANEIYLHINELFLEIVDYFDVYPWPFSQGVINRFMNINNWDYQKSFSKTLNLMLAKTTETKGLDLGQINTIFELYLNFVYSGSPEQHKEAKNWLLQVARNSYIKKIISDNFGAITQLDKQKKIIEIIIDTKDESLIKKTVKNILNSTQHENLKTTAEED